MRFINFAIVKFSFFLVLGILTSHFFPLSTLLWKLLAPLFLITVALWVWAQRQLLPNSYFAISVYLCLFAIGYVNYQMQLPQFKPNHYTNTISPTDRNLIDLKIVQMLKSDRFNDKYFAHINAVNGVRSTGKILLYFPKDSLEEILAPDVVFQVYGSITKIPKPLNPAQFDYAKYMELLGVSGQLRLSRKDILKRKRGGGTLLGIAQYHRVQIIEKLKQQKLKPNERAIIQALVLGERKDIPEQLYEEYAAAGAVHILAVSGLHIGILYLILGFMLKPLHHVRFGKYIHSLLVVVLLWGFALLSGLSPSVTRAVTMFSFFAVAGILDRRTNSVNTLFLSFFTLLTIYPLWLFQVGFQLSYLAVFFIIWLQPMLYKMGYSNYWVLRKAWAIISVTLCAQLGVLPLSMYYFHQFPGLFLITNLVVLPFLTILMFGGILIVLLAVLNGLPDWLSTVYNSMIEILNSFIHWVALQDRFLFSELHFSATKVLGFYLLIVALIMFLKKPNYRRAVTSLLAIALLITIYIYDKATTSYTELWIFHKSQQTLIGYKNGACLTVFSSDSTSTKLQDYPIKPFRIRKNIRRHSEENLQNIFRYRNKNILVLDSLGIFPKDKNIYALLLTNSPKVNLNRVIDSLRPKQIIADGSNFRTYVQRWEKTCQLKKLPFNYTAEQGAFPIE